MTLILETEPLPLRVEEDGTVRVGATRVTLDTVVRAYRGGASAELIQDQYSSVSLADVHAVIAYYLRHRVEVEAYLAARQTEAEELRRKIESEPSRDIRERLLKRRNAGRAQS